MTKSIETGSKIALCVLLGLGLLSCPVSLDSKTKLQLKRAYAQDVSTGQTNRRSEPEMPAPIRAMVLEGAQARYLGKSHDLDGWITIFQGQEQYFYVLPDGEAFVMGLLFDADGKLVTVRQVRDLQAQDSSGVLDMFAADIPRQAGMGEEKKNQSTAALATPADLFASTGAAERMFRDIESSNWVVLGNESAPYIYAFIDPQCGHCHAYLKDMRRDYIESGRLQVRLVPVGFRDGALAQAAFLLAAPDPQKRWFDHLDGAQDALPAQSDINKQGVQRNMALMQSWKFDVTPMTVYRAQNGEIKIIRGRAKDLEQLMADLGA